MSEKAGDDAPVVRIVHGAEEGRRTVLRRQALEEVALSPEVQARVAEMFGEQLSA